MLFCVNNKKKDKGTAGAKAPRDCYEIAKRMGAKEIVFYEPHKFKHMQITRFFALFTGIRNWIRLYRMTGREDWIIIQHPNENIIIGNKAIDFCKKHKALRFIGLVHDLDSLRRWASTQDSDKAILSDRNTLADEVLLKKCEVIICHNDSMKNYMSDRGFAVERLISLQIFDYLHDCDLPQNRMLERSIVVAGNLDKKKCLYLYKLIQTRRDYDIHLFGPNYDEKQKGKNVFYHGVYPADELPGMLQGAFGLVWDGTELESCSGDTGAYLRYNNPHKVSLFLSSDLPVIIWKEAALADFVEDNHLGLTIDSLSEIGPRLSAMTEEEYELILSHVKDIGEKLRVGFYTSNAIRKAMSQNE